MPSRSKEETAKNAVVVSTDVAGKKTRAKGKAKSPAESSIPEEKGSNAAEQSVVRKIQLELDGLLAAINSKNEDTADLLLGKLLKRSTKDFVYMDIDPETLTYAPQYRAYMDLTMYMAFLQECRIKSTALMAYLGLEQKFTTGFVTTFPDAIIAVINKVSIKPTEQLAEASALYGMLKSFRHAKDRMVCADIMPESKLENAAFESLSESFRFVYESTRNVRRLVRAGSGEKLVAESGSTTTSKESMDRMDAKLKKILGRFGG